MSMSTLEYKAMKSFHFFGLGNGNIGQLASEFALHDVMITNQDQSTESSMKYNQYL